MWKMNIDEQINQKVREYLGQDGIIVLKGVDISKFYSDLVIDIDKILNDKLAYFFEIYKMGRKIITYDEYLALYDFVVSQYKKIIILENNLYIHYYPLTAKINEEKIRELLCHFGEGEDKENISVQELKEYTDIYANVMEVNGKIYVAYNENIENEKEYIENIFHVAQLEIGKIEINGTSNSSKIVQIIDEEDYIVFLDNVLNMNSGTFYVIYKNSAIPQSILIERLSILNKYCGDNVKIKLAFTKDKRAVDIKEDYLNILKKYWGYNSFRSIRTYNLNQLELGKKMIEEVSQGEIISNIVEQVENCMNKKDYRDIFVTAPTGSGKSIMFQIPAIYLAEKYGLFTIVISPLIGLMKDQVKNLEIRNYKHARTINSDISPLERQKIIDDIHDGKCHILYISPESLLSKSDLEQIIGNRVLGLLVVDEAHIVTTWGKQFRPDYWYLGDHLSRLKKVQLRKEDKNMGFVIAAFTATAIYGGIENMYEETVQSLKMVNPIVYLGYIKREDIKINIDKTITITNKTEYELNKFDNLIQKIDEVMLEDKKMLIYFPTVALLERFYDYCYLKNIGRYVAKYHGKMLPDEKEDNYYKFLTKEKPIMIATKAFGMGIDIDDIHVVTHFAPTGNVCDYVQEIGRAARRKEIIGEAYYKFMSNDFKHINRLHGLSVIKEYQLVEVIKKVYEIYQENIKYNIKDNKKRGKRNEMLVDAESFAHIFENPFFSEDDAINKVKTAMLLIQKDFERKYSFSPFYVRPIPLFEQGFFEIKRPYVKEIENDYGHILDRTEEQDIYSVNLKAIWEKDFISIYSFPKFKYLLYSNSDELNFKYKNLMKPAIRVDISFNKNFSKNYSMYYESIKTIIRRCVREEKFYSIEGQDGLVEQLIKYSQIERYKAKCIVENIINALMLYQRNYSNNLNARVIKDKMLMNGEVKYIFYNGVETFFKWIEKFYNDLIRQGKNTICVVQNDGESKFKEIFTILGVLETLDILVFNALGGQNSQLYIYVNQTKTMKQIIEKPYSYTNKLLELVRDRHKLSVELMTHIFEGNYSSEEIWDILEDYFLGKLPEEVKSSSRLKELIKKYEDIL